MYYSLLISLRLYLIGLEQISRMQRSSRKSKQFLHTSRLLPMHQSLCRRRQVQRRNNVRRVRQLCLHLLTRDGLDFVDNQLPFPLCPDVTSNGGSVDGSQSETLLLVVKQRRMFVILENLKLKYSHDWNTGTPDHRKLKNFQ